MFSAQAYRVPDQTWEAWTEFAASSLALWANAGWGPEKQIQVQGQKATSSLKQF